MGAAHEPSHGHCHTGAGLGAGSAHDSGWAMVFNSIQYAVFLPVVLAVYWRLRHRGQNLLLLAASYLFYAAWDPRFLLLMMVSTGVDFFVGRALGRDDLPDHARKRVFLLSLVVNLGILGFFKYWGFFVDSAVGFGDTLGLSLPRPTLEVLLPVGISFYTFHGISYTFDVYRREIRPAADLVTFAVFVAFFPQLVAGPIGRAHIQLPQFEGERTPPDREEIRSALVLMLIGLTKKVALADAVAPMVNEVFSRPGRTGGLTLIVAAWAFALQIYGDFSGYSDIARGSSRLLGIELPENFRQPYLSRSITEFWRTWHISLSNWLRDYVYVPLGGNRVSTRRVYRNLILTMLIGGLWHGAAWTFVVWGAYHGVLLAVERALGIRVPADGPRLRPADVVRILVTFHLVTAGWILFRAATLGDAVTYLRRIVTLQLGGVPYPQLSLVIPALAAMVALDIASRRTRAGVALLAGPSFARGLAYGVMVLGIIVFSGGTPVPFIYFQF